MDNITLPEPVQSFLNGLESRAITNLYGTPGTGKTNICMIAAADCARKGGKVIFIDTEGGFSLERLKQIAPHDYEDILKNIELVEPRNLQEQTRVVRRLAERKPDLVILDSSVALYRIEHAEMMEKMKGDSRQKHEETNNPCLQHAGQPEAGENDRKCEMDSIMTANRELSKQLSTLSLLAREKGIPVLITTHAFKSWGNGSYDIVGGDPVRYWSKSIIYLEKTGKTSERRAVLIKHRSQPEGKEVKFMLVNEGIKPSGFKIF